MPPATEKEPVTAISYNGVSHPVFISSVDVIREPKPSAPVLSANISDIHTPHEERGHWGNKAEFILSCIGLSVGIGNVWRFPYLAYQNGGGAFLLPYILLLVVVGKPMYYMEVALGQFSSLGPLSVWRCFPLAKGIGAAMVVISILVAIYYNVIMGYCLYYMGQSFRSEVPWSGCHEWWGADNTTCYVRDRVDRCPVALDKLAREYSAMYNTSTLTTMFDNLVNVTLSDKTATTLVPREQFDTTLQNCTNATKTASEQFWERYVLDMSDGIEDIGTIKWDLAVCLLVSWFIVFLCLMKGVKSSGKVVYFTATFPYVILIILLIRGLMLEGAVTGLRYFFIPEWNKLLDITVWRAAAEQLFFSLSVSWGGLIMFGSYNKFYNKVHRDALFVSSLDFITSLIAGIVIFSVLGNMSDKLGIDIKDVVQGGQGLAFVVYPEALSHLPLPQIWSVLFFFMLYLLGLDSEFALLEVFLTAIYDEFPKLRNKKVLLTFVCCSACFLLGLPCVTQGGQYVLNLMDTYGGGFAVSFIAICELLALMWGYGLRRFCYDLQFMLHIRPNIFWKACWLVIAPLVLAFIFVYSLSQHKTIKYGEYYQYPQWADGIGWIFALISMIQIPVWGIAILLWNIRNVKKVFNPDARWGPSDPEIRQQYFQKKDNGFVMSQIDTKGLDNLGLEAGI
ncbi:sodium- and chloride-dependent glycine transporter 2-like [Limulus polyphemus]|uniref:Transporter n=1 Tax=Limulus polyphemus TaxID=6850 RepID=A0ABM1RW70_LIMPO|nr:sodium- and chloride-dependent glycine transporter 2-like [Limulus polyphemus]XP_022235625.1 sodium- and chloride-dependent glycine transporter 2-like [Limulus polyphemus]